MLLMLQNRITSVNVYNKLISKYVETVSNSDQLSDNSKNEMIPFYTYFLLGHDSMCETYAKVMTLISDDARI